MKGTILVLLCTLSVLIGCQSEDNLSNPDQNSTSVEGSASTTSDEVTEGMEMADVKKIKGAPDDTRHEHGDEGAEIDIWVYGSEEVRFVDGKVEK